jgi:hypothetical protein
MRGRLGMYIGTPSLTRLAAFLRGYEHALQAHGISGADEFLPDFRDWIHKRFGSSQRSWEETIVLHSADEAEAMKRFWELLDEYLDDRKLSSSVATKAIAVKDNARQPPRGSKAKR